MLCANIYKFKWDHTVVAFFLLVGEFYLFISLALFVKRSTRMFNFKILLWWKFMHGVMRPVFTKMSYSTSAAILFQLHQTKTLHLLAPKEPNHVPTVLRGGHYSAGAFYTLGRVSVNDLGVSEFFLASVGHCFAALMTCLCVKGQHWKESFAREMKHWSLGWNPASLPLSWYITKWLVNKFIFNIHLHEQSGYVHLLHCSGQEPHSYTLRMRIILRLERFLEYYLTPSG